MWQRMVDTGFVLLVAGLLLLTTAGCGGGPANAHVVELLLASQRDQPLTFMIEAPRVLEKRSIPGTPQYSVEVEATAKLRTELYEALPLVDAFRFYKYDPTAFHAAYQQWTQLRMPERAQAAAQLPQRKAPATVYRRRMQAEERFPWKGRLVLQPEQGMWTLVDVAVQLPDELNSDQLLTLSDLPETALIIGQQSSSDPLAELIAQQQAFIPVVVAARQAIQQRLNAERERLISALQVGRVWQVSIPGRDNGPQVFLARVGEGGDAEGHGIPILWEHATNPLRRTTWVAHLELAPAPEATDLEGQASRPVPDGWTAVVEPVAALRDGTLGLPPSLRLYVDTSSDVIRVGHLQIQWQRHTASPLPTLQVARKQLQAATASGQTWTGTLQYPARSAFPIRLTFLPDDNPDARAILSLDNDPSTIAVFAGANFTQPTHVYTWPIVLQRTQAFGPLKTTYASATSIPAFSRGNVTSELRLHFNADGSLSGLIDSGDASSSAVLQLAKSDSPLKLVSVLERWQQALQVDAVWNGSLEFDLDPATPVQLTVVECSNDASLVRIIAVDRNNPQRFASLVGTLDRSDNGSEGYALSLQRTNISPQVMQPGGESYHALFGSSMKLHPDLRQRFHLSPDGTTLYGISSGEERLVLSRDPVMLDLPATAGEFQKLWQEVLTAKTTWKGTARTLNGVATEVTWQFTMSETGNRTVQALLSLPKSRNGKVAYAGQLSDEPDLLYGHALILRKQTKGNGPSVLLGERLNAELHLRLSPDGRQLIGMARDNDTWTEFLELQRP